MLWNFLSWGRCVGLSEGSPLLMRFEPETSRSVTVFVLIIQSELMVIFEAARNDLPANHPLTEQM